MKAKKLLVLPKLIPIECGRNAFSSMQRLKTSIPGSGGQFVKQ
jgi:hypothetical protein